MFQAMQQLWQSNWKAATKVILDNAPMSASLPAVENIEQVYSSYIEWVQHDNEPVQPKPNIDPEIQVLPFCLMEINQVMAAIDHHSTSGPDRNVTFKQVCSLSWAIVYQLMNQWLLSERVPKQINTACRFTLIPKTQGNLHEEENWNLLL